MSKDPHLKQLKTAQVYTIKETIFIKPLISSIGVLTIIITVALLMGTVWLYVLRTFTKVNQQFQKIKQETDIEIRVLYGEQLFVYLLH